MARIFPILIFLAAACTQGGGGTGPNTARLPDPGTTRVGQMYILGTHASTLFPLPSPMALATALGAHVERKDVSTLEEAKETLQAWNARPVDWLVLEKGLPQEVWSQLKLPKVAGRKVVYLGARKVLPPDEVAVSVDEKRVKAFLERLCSRFKEQGCRTVPAFFERAGKNPLILSLGNERESTDTGASVFLSLVPRWAALFRQIREGHGSALSATDRYLIDFRSGYMELRDGPALKSFPQRAEAEKFLREWNLDELSRGPE